MFSRLIYRVYFEASKYLHHVCHVKILVELGTNFTKHFTDSLQVILNGVLESGQYKAPLSYMIYGAYYCPPFMKVGPYLNHVNQVQLCVDQMRVNQLIPHAQKSVLPKHALFHSACIKGILVVWDFCFWAVWAARPVLKKRLGANYEQLLRPVFHVVGGQTQFVRAAQIIKFECIT